MFRNCSGSQLPEAMESNAHFFYDQRIIGIDELLPKR